MVELTLTAEEAQTLREYLAVQLEHMSMEIAATDNPRFRQVLRERRDALSAVRDRLATAGVG